MHAAIDTWNPAPAAQGPTRPGLARTLWVAAGVVMCGLAIIGAVLPVMPTTVFVLAAAACFSKGSPRLERWLLDHPVFGPGLRGWRAERAIPRRGKVAAVVSMAGSALLVASTAPTAVAVGVGAILAAVSAYVVTRPEPRGAFDATA